MKNYLQSGQLAGSCVRLQGHMWSGTVQSNYPTCGQCQLLQSHCCCLTVSLVHHTLLAVLALGVLLSGHATTKPVKRHQA
jgi:hypothetical protein